MRKQKKEKSEKASATPPDAVALDAAEESDYERFEKLTRKLVNVPKKEIDEKRTEGGA